MYTRRRLIRTKRSTRPFPYWRGSTYLTPFREGSRVPLRPPSLASPPGHRTPGLTPGPSQTSSSVKEVSVVVPGTTPPLPPLPSNPGSKSSVGEDPRLDHDGRTPLVDPQQTFAGGTEESLGIRSSGFGSVWSRCREGALRTAITPWRVQQKLKGQLRGKSDTRGNLISTRTVNIPRSFLNTYLPTCLYVYLLNVYVFMHYKGEPLRGGRKVMPAGEDSVDEYTKMKRVTERSLPEW